MYFPLSLSALYVLLAYALNVLLLLHVVLVHSLIVIVHSFVVALTVLLVLQLVGFACVIVIVGAVVSTVIVLLAALAKFLFHAPSLTLSAANVNVVLHAAFAVYVNVYVIPFVTLHVTALLLNVTLFAVPCAIAPLVRLNVLIALHVEIHVNVIVHVLYHATVDIGFLLGCALTVHTGFVVSIFSILLLPLNVIFHMLSTALKHTYFPLSPSVLNVKLFHAV